MKARSAISKVKGEVGLGSRTLDWLAQCPMTGLPNAWLPVLALQRESGGIRQRKNQQCRMARSRSGLISLGLPWRPGPGTVFIRTKGSHCPGTFWTHAGNVV